MLAGARAPVTARASGALRHSLAAARCPAAALSSKRAFTPALTSAQLAVAAAPGMDRVAAAVCEARLQNEPAAVERVWTALRSAQVPAALRPAVAAAVGNALLAAPAFAEAGKIFDFNLTLPLMAGQFLLLMIVLDKLVYTPVGKVLDDRDAQLRTKLEAVKDNSSDLLKYTEEADRIIAGARNEASAAIAKAKQAADAESATKVAAAKAKLDKELKAASAALEQQRQASLASIDAEVAKLSDSIVKKLIPVA